MNAFKVKKKNKKNLLQLQNLAQYKLLNKNISFRGEKIQTNKKKRKSTMIYRVNHISHISILYIITRYSLPHYLDLISFFLIV